MAETNEKTTGRGRKPSGSGSTKQLLESQKKIKELEQKIEELTEVHKEKTEEKGSSDKTYESVIGELKGQVEVLTKQVMDQQAYRDPNRPKYRTPTDDDVQDESVTFVAPQVYLVVGSYIDSKGIERIPPFKLFKFVYAASDHRKEGKETEIKNYAQYVTNLTEEIKFLRNHPAYNVRFFENVNEALNQDLAEHEFRTRAANQVAGMAPEAVIQECRIRKVPNVSKSSVHELRAVLTTVLANEYVRSAKELADEQIKRRAFAASGGN